MSEQTILVLGTVWAGGVWTWIQICAQFYASDKRREFVRILAGGGLFFLLTGVGLLSVAGWTVPISGLVLALLLAILAIEFRRLRHTRAQQRPQVAPKEPKVPVEPSPGPKAVSVAQPEQAKKNTIKWRSSGNLFWLGHDLVWTIDTLLRGGPRDQIFHGLRQSLHHLRSLGFVGTPIESRVDRLTADAERSLDKDWTAGKRKRYTAELASIVRAIGDLAEASQPDFEPGPKA